MGAYFSALADFIKKYPLQTASITLAGVAIAMNIKETATIVKALQLRK